MSGKLLLKWFIVLLASVLVYGCATAPRKPDWVMKGAGAFRGEGKSLFGVGAADGITSETLRRTTADNRAIDEKVFDRLKAEQEKRGRQMGTGAAVELVHIKPHLAY